MTQRLETAVINLLRAIAQEQIGGDAIHTSLEDIAKEVNTTGDAVSYQIREGFLMIKDTLQEGLNEIVQAIQEQKN